ncbi:two-component response regulator 24-like [Magnolia sinica]|uniref:two-component response regulator 24-like n=1 Tax=Magnolia sinica TaxID=86752 RepID=UPI0026598D59|nr:two-component response regulator 24-like [Magnolia sinica]
MPFGMGSSSSSKKSKNVAVDASGPLSMKNGPNKGVSGLNLKKQLSVLVVDDNPVNRKILKMMLANLGVEAQEAENGQEAVDLHLGGAHFDLILIDMEMPVMDGPQATRVLRTMGVGCKMIGVSANSRNRDKQVFMEAGIDEYHVKPMTRPKLISILKEVDDA